MIGLSLVQLAGAASAVAGGAFLGGMLRGLLRHRPGRLTGTPTANLVACLVLGVVPGTGIGGGGFSGAYLWQQTLGVGFSGALSTWSTLVNELGSLLNKRDWRLLLPYTSATCIGGLAATWAGWQLGTVQPQNWPGATLFG